MSKVLQKACKELRVVTVEARQMIGAIAGPREWADTRQSWLAKAARRLGFPYARTANIWYGRARLIRAEEWITLNQTIADLNKRAAERQGDIADAQGMARSRIAASVDLAGPPRVDGGPAVQTGPGAVDPAGGRSVRPGR
jgi:hypothetical protein